MRVKNGRSLLDLAKNLSIKTGIPSYTILQAYMLERIVKRISLSNYRFSLLIKGGFLISSLVGIDTRTSMDLDTTVTGSVLSEEEATSIIKEVLDTNAGDNIHYEIKKIVPILIRSDTCKGVRVYLDSYFDGIIMHLYIDLTYGEETKFRGINYDFPSIFDEETIPVMSYSVEDILDDKICAILSRKETTTRLRDYYDLYIIYGLYKDKIDYKILKKKLSISSKERGINDELKNYSNVISTLKYAPSLIRHWQHYQKNYPYAANISFDETCDALLSLLNRLY
ncbi:MAG: nucleotidyl transferase AbiEii/AbiGii toxin family protein [Coprobacillus sp.]|nr:nucleotidyl transferase AbiEii/AbiGii toxin family protein [Coprobacillus sp.]